VDAVPTGPAAHEDNEIPSLHVPDVLVLRYDSDAPAVDDDVPCVVLVEDGCPVHRGDADAVAVAPDPVHHPAEEIAWVLHPLRELLVIII
jgi:hypothetical protein